MKISKNNKVKLKIKEEIREDKAEETKSYPKTHICEQCRRELEYTKSDLSIGEFGAAFIRCPYCNSDTCVDDDSLTLTMNNVEFPKHFHHTSKENGAVDVCNNAEIKLHIKNAIEYFRKNKDAFVWHSECGNLSLIVFRYDGDENYDVVLSNNYYSTYIPFESEDYKIGG